MSSIIAHLNLNYEEEEYFSRHLIDFENLFLTDEDIEDSLEKIKEAQVLSVFIKTKITKETIEKLPNLKLIVTRSTGFDHIDTVYCQEKGIEVCNVPFYGENTVAEHAFALLLSIVRKLTPQIERTKKADYNYLDLLGSDLENKTIGIIGAGRIGLRAVKIAKGFGMKVLAFDVFKQDFLAEILDYKYVELDELFEKSDIISVHAPYNKYTHHMVDKNAFSKMKKGVVLINTSRGGLINTKDLIEALDEGIVSNVGLDVLEEENELFSGQASQEVKNLITRENVFFTPHTAYYTKEANERIWQTTLQNILNFIEGKKVESVLVKR